MSAESRIVLIDDHAVFRDGLKQVIAADPDLEVVGEAGDRVAALALVSALAPDVAVVDLDLPGPGGLELIGQLRRLPRPPAIVTLTMHREDRLVHAALDRGARGYLTKEDAAAKLVHAIRTVLSGQIFVAPGLAGTLPCRAAARRDGAHGLAGLTPSELRVLKLVARNQTNQQIAHHLFVSRRTVEGHRASICTKLGLQGEHALLQFARKHGDAL